MERELRIYIAEDDGGVIDTLRDFIEDQGLGEVVGSSEDDGGDALQIAALHLFRQCLCAELLREVIRIAHDPLDFLGIFPHQIEFAL